MSEELKPCPFCGGKAALRMFWMADGHRYRAVECVECGATTPGNYSEVGDQSAWDWNARTPEQAIAATLGGVNPDGLPNGLTLSDDGKLLNWRGENYVRQSALSGSTLTAHDVWEAIGNHGVSHLQAIADELNATLGGGECENVSEYAKECNHFKCSECGCAVEDAEGYYVSVHGKNWEHQLPWSFCPNCGARVRKKVGE